MVRNEAVVCVVYGSHYRALYIFISPDNCGKCRNVRFIFSAAE